MYLTSLHVALPVVCGSTSKLQNNANYSREFNAVDDLAASLIDTMTTSKKFQAEQGHARLESLK